ncbi:hypothetical protein ACFFX0_19825 [Citricoccus parietis]|uniref:Uncharacterized protein n=1 Tax=Citricoccus parietis TaxID=592307 RepID=A0ABV5G315_9MICC
MAGSPWLYCSSSIRKPTAVPTRSSVLTGTDEARTSRSWQATSRPVVAGGKSPLSATKYSGSSA